ADASESTTFAVAAKSGAPVLLACDVCGDMFPTDQVTRRVGETICKACEVRRAEAGNNETMAGNTETIADGTGAGGDDSLSAQDSDVGLKGGDDSPSD